jgi:hypothetical protein
LGDGGARFGTLCVVLGSGPRRLGTFHQPFEQFHPAAHGLHLKGKAEVQFSILPQYASEPPGKARLRTCLDQYNANKASDANGGLKWIEPGGGYFSACNNRLKS